MSSNITWRLQVFPSSSLYCCSFIHCIFRSGSTCISINCNTIRSTTSLVFQFSCLLRSRHDRLYLPLVCLQAQSPRWYVHLISPFTLHPSQYIYFAFKTTLTIWNTSSQHVSHTLAKPCRRKTQPAAVKNWGASKWFLLIRPYIC